MKDCTLSANQGPFTRVTWLWTNILSDKIWKYIGDLLTGHREFDMSKLHTTVDLYCSVYIATQ